MLILSRHLPAGSAAAPARSMTLAFAERQKSRLRATLDDGTEVGLRLPRGLTLRGGDILCADSGEQVRVRARPEPVSTVHAPDAAALARAAYHLGNRHVALQIGAGWLRYLADPVLDELVRGLGLEIRAEEAGFEPEAGAYGRHEPHHGH